MNRRALQTHKNKADNPKRNRYRNKHSRDIHRRIRRALHPMRGLQKGIHPTYLGRSSLSPTTCQPQKNILLTGVNDFKAQCA